MHRLLKGLPLRGASVLRVVSILVRSDNLVRLFVLAALVLFFAANTSGLTVGPANISNVIIQSAITGIAACGQALIVLTASLDLSVAGIVAIAAMLGGSLITANPQFQLLGTAFSPWLAIPAMLLVGTAFGFGNGYVISRFRLPSLVVTLGTWQIGTGLAYEITGSGFVDKIPAGIAFVGQGSVHSVPIPILLFFSIVAVTYFLLHHTPFGSEVYAVGGNPRTAFISGVNVRRVRITVFAMAGFLYAVGALIGLSRYQSATMEQATGLELATIAAVTIGGVSLAGGKGDIIGVLLGTLIIGVIDNGLSVMGVGPAYQAIAKGCIIILAVMIDNFWRPKQS